MKKVILIAGCLLLPACATATSNYGTDFSDESAASITNGQSMSQVAVLLGSPTGKTVNAGGLVTWTYTFMTSTAKVKNIFSYDMSTQTVTKTLKIVFQDGIVTDYEYANNGMTGSMEVTAP